MYCGLSFSEYLILAQSIRRPLVLKEEYVDDGHPLFQRTSQQQLMIMRFNTPGPDYNEKSQRDKLTHCSWVFIVAY